MSNMTMGLQNRSPKIPRKSIFGAKFEFIFVFHEFLLFEEMKGVDFNYGNRFFKFHSKTTQIRHF